MFPYEVIVRQDAIDSSNHKSPPDSPAPVGVAPRHGFVRGLFDVSLTTFVTTRVLKVLYVLFLVSTAVELAAGMVSGALQVAAVVALDGEFVTALPGLFLMGVTPIVTFLLLILGRVGFECTAVFFRIAEHLGEIDRKTREPS